MHYFVSVELHRRLAPDVHIAIRGAVSRAELREVLAATYDQVWKAEQAALHPGGGPDRSYRAFLIRARENRHRPASRMDSASTAAKSPMNSEATPTPTTGMIRPV